MYFLHSHHIQSTLNAGRDQSNEEESPKKLTLTNIKRAKHTQKSSSAIATDDLYQGVGTFEATARIEITYVTLVRVGFYEIILNMIFFSSQTWRQRQYTDHVAKTEKIGYIVVLFRTQFTNTAIQFGIVTKYKFTPILPYTKIFSSLALISKKI